MPEEDILEAVRLSIYGTDLHNGIIEGMEHLSQQGDDLETLVNTVTLPSGLTFVPITQVAYENLVLNNQDITGMLYFIIESTPV